MKFHVTFVIAPNYVELPFYILIFNPNESVLGHRWLTILFASSLKWNCFSASCKKHVLKQIIYNILADYVFNNLLDLKSFVVASFILILLEFFIPTCCSLYLCVSLLQKWGFRCVSTLSNILFASCDRLLKRLFKAFLIYKPHMPFRL